MYLTCMDHDPPLLADDESGQHHYDLPRIWREIENREEVANRMHDNWTNIEEYFESRSAKFLAAHPRCDIGVTDEYGVRHPKPSTGTTPSSPCAAPKEAQ